MKTSTCDKSGLLQQLSPLHPHPRMVPNPRIDPHLPPPVEILHVNESFILLENVNSLYLKVMLMLVLLIGLKKYILVRGSDVSLLSIKLILCVITLMVKLKRRFDIAHNTRCSQFVPTNGSNSLLRADQLTALPFSSSKCPRHTAAALMTSLQR